MNPEEEIPDEVRPRAYYNQKVWKRIFVIAAGPFVNIVLALIIFFVLAAGFGLDGRVTNEVGQVSPDLPAGKVLQSGDSLVSVDGVDVSDLQGQQLIDRVSALIGKHQCDGAQTDGCEASEPVKLVVDRNGAAQSLTITPVYDVPPKADQDAGLEPAMRIGFGYTAEREQQSVVDAAQFSLDRAWYITSQTANTFAHIFESETRDQISGVVGVTEVTRQSFEFDVRQALGVLGVISLSLGLVNLLPFLPLDGGHIFWSIVEKLRGPQSLAPDDGAGQLRRLRARPDAVLHRPQQRHRPHHRRGVQRQVTVV